MNSVPSVVTNDGHTGDTVTSPLNRPTSIAAISAPIIAGTSGRPSLCILYNDDGANRYTAPTDRSISAMIISEHLAGRRSRERGEVAGVALEADEPVK